MQAAGVGVVVHRSGLGERAAVGDLDAQLPVVDAATSPASWAASLRTKTRWVRICRPGFSGPKTMVPTWKPPSATTPIRASVCSSVVRTRLSTTSKGAPSTVIGDWV